LLFLLLLWLMLLSLVLSRSRTAKEWMKRGSVQSWARWRKDWKPREVHEIACCPRPSPSMSWIKTLGSWSPEVDGTVELGASPVPLLPGAKSGLREECAKGSQCVAAATIGGHRNDSNCS
jgi:hypothetical protein